MNALAYLRQALALARCGKFALVVQVLEEYRNLPQEDPEQEAKLLADIAEAMVRHYHREVTA